MKENRLQKRKVYGKQIYKGLLVVLSTLIIVYFMPRSESVGYSYEIGLPWINKQLIAPFTFAIYKSDSVMQHERDSVRRAFQPYYHVDSKVKDTMKKRLLTNKSHEWTGHNSGLYVRHIMQLLDTVYSRGVLSMEEYDSLVKDKKYVVKVVEERAGRNEATKSLFTQRTAYEYIMNADTAKYSRLVMQHFNVSDLIVPNLKFDKEKSKAELDDMLSSISGASGMVQSGQKIIDRGEIVDEKKAAIIESLVRESNKHTTGDSLWRLKILGQVAYVLFICLVLLSYLNLFRPDYFDTVGTGILLFGIMDFFCCTAASMVAHNFYHILILPCCMLPIFVRVFLDSRTAFMFHCAMVMIISSFLREPYEFLILQLTTGMVAIQTLRELSQRSQIIRTAAVITLTYVVIHTSFVLIQNDEFRFDRSNYIYMMVNGILLLFTYPLLYLFEKAFGFVSDVTLVELSNISNPLLQRMSEIAPGTFQHSMQVANLSAEVAKKIGARSQLVRTGALYHDIGKLERPAFFTENQQNGVSPHSQLTPERSAEVIIAHVYNGASLADKNNLPAQIKNFILTHHGKGKTMYFYVTWKNEHPNEEIDPALFTYPGPNPSTKEEAILMMADAVEAASRSLTEYTEDSISNLVDKIIDAQMKEGYFSTCDITFKDIATAKDVFKEKLKIVYHTRISYPELNNKK